MTMNQKTSPIPAGKNTQNQDILVSPITLRTRKIMVKIVPSPRPEPPPELLLIISLFDFYYKDTTFFRIFQIFLQIFVVWNLHPGKNILLIIIINSIIIRIIIFKPSMLFVIVSKNSISVTLFCLYHYKIFTFRTWPTRSHFLPRCCNK